MTTYITTELSFPTNRICTKLVFLNPDSPIYGLDTDEMVAPMSVSRPKEAGGSLMNSFPSVLYSEMNGPLTES